jgi:hypothetical protein
MCVRGPRAFPGAATFPLDESLPSFASLGHGITPSPFFFHSIRGAIAVRCSSLVPSPGRPHRSPSANAEASLPGGSTMYVSYARADTVRSL